MRRRLTSSSVRRICDVNLTSMMDLTFLLLITFIITYPLMEQGIPVNLPRGQAKELTPDRALTVSVDAKGLVYLDHERLTLSELAARLESAARTQPQVTVMVRADETVRYGEVVAVLRVLHQARITRLALVTRPES